MFNHCSVNPPSHPSPVISLKVGVSLHHSVSLCFVSLPALWTLWVTYQAKNNVRNSNASTLLLQVSHWSCNVCTANHHLRGSRERNGAQRTKVSFGGTMMQALELLRWVKRKNSQRSNLQQCKNQVHSDYQVTRLWRNE